MLVNNGWLDFSNFKVFVEISADEHGLNIGLDFKLRSVRPLQLNLLNITVSDYYVSWSKVKRRKGAVRFYLFVFLFYLAK